MEIVQHQVALCLSVEDNLCIYVRPTDSCIEMLTGKAVCYLVVQVSQIFVRGNKRLRIASAPIFLSLLALAAAVTGNSVGDWRHSLSFCCNFNVPSSLVPILLMHFALLSSGVLPLVLHLLSDYVFNVSMA